MHTRRDTGDILLQEKILDVLSARQMKAQLLLQLGRAAEAEKLYRCRLHHAHATLQQHLHAADLQAWSKMISIRLHAGAGVVLNPTAYGPVDPYTVVLDNCA